MTRGYQIFARQLAAAGEEYPTLAIVEENREKFLKGILEVVDKDGKLWESFEVEIRYKQGFPNRFPKLFETGGKIPKIVDWHVFPHDKSSCITILPHEIILCIDEITVVDFIGEQALPHLFNQTHRMKEGHYVNGEFDHDIEGFWQFYEDELGTTDRKKIVQTLHKMARLGTMNRQSQCFCGSGIKYRNCHRAAHLRLSKLGGEYLLNEAETLLRSLRR